jgi:hypothetical protein
MSAISLSLKEAQTVLSLGQLTEDRSAEENAVLTKLVNSVTDLLCDDEPVDLEQLDRPWFIETYYKVKYGTGPAQWLSVHCFDTLEAAERYSANSNGQGIRKYTVTSEDVR